METIKIIRNIENYKSRVNDNTYDTITAQTVNFNIFLEQKMDDQGVFTDMEFNPLLPYLTQKPNDLGVFNSFVYGRFPAAPLSFYLPTQLKVEGKSDDSQLPNVSSYRIDQNTRQPIYVSNLDMTVNSDLIFTGVLSQDNEKIVYAINSFENNISGTGIHYITFKNEYVNRVEDDGTQTFYKSTDFYTELDSINDSNVTLSALTKQEEYLGLVFKPEVDSEVFIDRGVSDIFERHALLGELKTTNDIDTNRGGFIRT